MGLAKTSVNFTEEEQELMEALKEASGLTPTGIIRAGIRALAKNMGVKVPKSKKKEQ